MNRNSSTSSSEPAWRRFALTLLAAAFLSAGLLYLLILIVDPYDSVPFSPNWDRYTPRGDNRHWISPLRLRAVLAQGDDDCRIGDRYHHPIPTAAVGHRLCSRISPLATRVMKSAR